MINANELRIGNWVQNKSEYIRVKDFDTIGINARPQVGGYLDTLDRVSAIPLTPEILEKAGFSSSFTSDPQEPNPSKTYKRFGVEIHQPEENKNKFIICIGEIFDIKYVHQVQNLIHATTGIELAIHF